MAEDFGVEDRGHFYDPVGALRDVVVNHLMQVVAAAAMEAPAGGDPTTLKDAQVARLPRDRRRPTRRTTCAASTTATATIDGVAADSTTETYAALRLEIDNWRWSGVPFFIRTGKRLPVTQTELRLVFKHPPRLGFAALERAGPSRTSSSSSSTRRPASGSIARRAPRRRRRRRSRSTLDMEFAEEGGEGADAVRGAAARGDGRRQHALHPPGRRRGDLADHAAAARRAAAGAPVRAGHRGGRRRPTSSSPATAAGTDPGSTS